MSECVIAYCVFSLWTELKHTHTLSHTCWTTLCQRHVSSRCCWEEADYFIWRYGSFRHGGDGASSPRLCLRLSPSFRLCLTLLFYTHSLWVLLKLHCLFAKAGILEKRDFFFLNWSVIFVLIKCYFVAAPGNQELQSFFCFFWTCKQMNMKIETQITLVQRTLGTLRSTHAAFVVNAHLFNVSAIVPSCSLETSHPLFFSLLLVFYLFSHFSPPLHLMSILFLCLLWR